MLSFNSEVHTKLCLELEWCTFHILTSEDIDGVIFRSYTLLLSYSCAKILLSI